MKRKNYLCALSILVAVASLQIVTGCASDGPPPISEGGGGGGAQSGVPHKLQIGVDSEPPGATITVNGRRRGLAPISIEVALDANGDLVENLDVQADFSTAYLVGGSIQNPYLSEQYQSGDKPPSIIRFRAEVTPGRSSSQ